MAQRFTITDQSNLRRRITYVTTKPEHAPGMPEPTPAEPVYLDELIAKKREKARRAKPKF